ncbi:MAG: YqgE/AlgH family protein [Myxococcota bacterium]
MSFTLAPGLLIAMPSLADPNFHRSVIVLAAHTREGAFGLVINQPLDLPVAAICSEAGIAWRGGHTQKVLCGGPVERQRGWLLHATSKRFEGTQVVDEGLSLTASRDGLVAYASDPDGTFRLLLGYAGWGPGQLDREVLQGSWLTAPLRPELVFDTPRADVWARALSLSGIDPAHLVDAPPTHLH